MPSFDIDINFNLDTSGIEDAEAQLGDLKDSAEEIGGSTDGATDSMDDFKQKTDEANESMQNTTDSAMGLGEALVGIGGAVGLDAMIQTGDNIQTSWNRLSLTFANTGVSMDALKQKSSELQSATGRSGGEIREYFNQMGLAGVTNTELLSSSFEGLSAKSYQTGNSIQSMTAKMSMMSMSGNASARMLKNLGINTTDLANAMGVTEDQVSETFKSLSQEERLEALTKAMGDGTQANEMYKNSYAGLKAQAETSLAGLTGAIGQSILPTVIPALQTAKSVVDGLANAWKGLPTPITTVLGALGGGVVGITALVTSLALLGKVGSTVVNGLKSIRDGYNTMRTAMSTAKMMIEAVRNAESLSQGVRSALALATGTATTVEEANAVAKASAIAPTTGLAIAENSLLLPILLVIGAIVGLIAVLWYLYNNNETVRNGINALIGQFQQFMMKLEIVKNIIVMFMQVAIQRFIEWVNNGRQSATNLVTSIYNALVNLPSRVSSALSGVKNAITKPFTDAYNIVKPYIDQIGSAWNQISSVFNGFEGYEGFSGNVGYEGFNGSLNSALASNTSNSTNVTNNFNINGIIEESASEYIVGAVNNHIKKQNLVRGV